MKFYRFFFSVFLFSVMFLMLGCGPAPQEQLNPASGEWVANGGRAVVTISENEISYNNEKTRIREWKISDEGDYKKVVGWTFLDRGIVFEVGKTDSMKSFRTWAENDAERQFVDGARVLDCEENCDEIGTYFGAFWFTARDDCPITKGSPKLFCSVE